jgi:hypothetical protein
MKYYTFVSDFVDNIAYVILNGKYGYINEQYDEICEIKYDDAWPFINNFARVKINNRWGFIDINCKEICDIKYDYVWNFKEGFAYVSLNDNWGIINIKGEEIIKPIYNLDEIYNILNQYIKNKERNLKLNLMI